MVERRRLSRFNNGDGIFARGHKKVGGRKKGTPNRTTAILKDVVLAAATSVGEDGRGRGGLEGYLRHIARREPKSFVTLLARVIPTQHEHEHTGKDGGPVDVVHSVRDEIERRIAGVAARLAEEEGPSRLH